MLSCTNRRLDANQLIDIFTMPTIPQIDGFSNFDLYSSRPQKIFYLTKSNESDWEIKDYKNVVYELNETITQYSMTIKTFRPDDSLKYAYEVKDLFTEGKLATRIVTNLTRETESNKKLIIYEENKIYIDVFFKGVLKEKYIYQFSESGLLESFSSSYLSSTSGNWEVRYIN